MSETLFLVDAGGVRTVRGTTDGTPVTRSFRITANEGRGIRNARYVTDSDATSPR